MPHHGNCATVELPKTCPLRGKCLSESIVYKATVTHDNENKVYFGLTGGTFKERYRNHTKSIRNKKYENETELSKYIWDLKKQGANYTLRWDIMKKSNTHKRKSGLCNLCLEEKFIIATHKNNMLNRRSELIGVIVCGVCSCSLLSVNILPDFYSILLIFNQRSDIYGCIAPFKFTYSLPGCILETCA